MWSMRGSGWRRHHLLRHGWLDVPNQSTPSRQSVQEQIPCRRKCKMGPVVTEVWWPSPLFGVKVRGKEERRWRGKENVARCVGRGHSSSLYGGGSSMLSSSEYAGSGGSYGARRDSWYAGGGSSGTGSGSATGWGMIWGHTMLHSQIQIPKPEPYHEYKKYLLGLVGSFIDVVTGCGADDWIFCVWSTDMKHENGAGRPILQTYCTFNFKGHAKKKAERGKKAEKCEKIAENAGKLIDPPSCPRNWLSADS